MIIYVSDVPKVMLLKILYDYAESILFSLEPRGEVEAEQSEHAVDEEEVGFWERIYTRPISLLRVALDHVCYQKDQYFDSVDLGSGDIRLNISFYSSPNIDSTGYDALYGPGAALQAITSWRVTKEEDERVRAQQDLNEAPKIKRRYTI